MDRPVVAVVLVQVDRLEARLRAERVQRQVALAVAVDRVSSQEEPVVLDRRVAS